MDWVRGAICFAMSISASKSVIGFDRRTRNRVTSASASPSLFVCEPQSDRVLSLSRAFPTVSAETGAADVCQALRM
jgi:hypothetical protein